MATAVRLRLPLLEPRQAPRLSRQSWKPVLPMERSISLREKPCGGAAFASRIPVRFQGAYFVGNFSPLSSPAKACNPDLGWEANMNKRIDISLREGDRR
jgi:hypothetical protein